MRPATEFRRALVLGIAVVVLHVAACSGSEQPAERTTTKVTLPSPPNSVATTTSSVATTSTTASAPSTLDTTTSTVDVWFAPPDPFVGPPPTSTGGGSGCSPGSGTLPDGVWFGFLDGTTDMTVEFDLACYLSCDPDGAGFRIGNRNPRVRTLTVDAAAVVTFESVNGPDWEDPFDRVAGYEDVGLHTKAWVYVNDSEVTHIVLPATSRGRRYTDVEVDWVLQLPEAGLVAFNDLGLIASKAYGIEENLFYWRSDDWQSATELEGSPYGGSGVASGATVAIGANVYRWTESTWFTDVFDALGGEPYALATSGDRVLMSAYPGDDVIVYVLTWSGDSWSVDTIPVGTGGDWMTMSGAISGDTFAISDTGIESAQRTGIVRIFTWNGASWTQTASLRDQWDTGNWGSSLYLNGDGLLVGADGATPGPGSPGGVYLYTRAGDTWTPEVVGEGGEGFGFGARIDGDTIVTAGGHSEATAFWVFVNDAGKWRGTPIVIDELDTEHSWIYGIDLHDGLVAISTSDSVRIGTLKPAGS